jgi:hypothetical protein
MAMLEKIGQEKQRLSEQLMRVEQRRLRSNFVATKPSGRARNPRNVG